MTTWQASHSYLWAVLVSGGSAVIITKNRSSSLPKILPLHAPSLQSRQICHISPGRVSGSNQGPSCWAHYKAAAPHYQSEGKKRDGPLGDTNTAVVCCDKQNGTLLDFPRITTSTVFICMSCTAAQSYVSPLRGFVLFLGSPHFPTILLSALLFLFLLPFLFFCFCIVASWILIGNFQRVTPA